MKHSFKRFSVLTMILAMGLIMACSSGGEDQGITPVSGEATAVPSVPSTPDSPSPDSTSSPTRQPTSNPSGSPSATSIPVEVTAAPTITPSEPPAEPEQLPRREVRFTVNVPGTTPTGEQVYLLLKPMIDWWWTEDTHIPMSNNGDGTWSTSTLVPEGGLIQYVYDRWDEQEWGEPFKETREGSGRAVSIESRFLLVTPALEQVQDTVEMWQDLPAAASAGSVGSITGSVFDAESGEPVFDAEVTAGGMHTASVFGGSFEFPQLAAGTQRVIVWQASGAYKPVSVEVEVSPGSAANVRIEMEPAAPVQVTFDLTLPVNTPSEAEIKLLGNVWQLGARQSSHPNFPHSPDGTAVPVVQRLAGNRAKLTLDLHEGMFLHYYYTIGDGFNARERAAEGDWNFREHIVGPADESLADEVDRWWNSGQALAAVRVKAPANTTPGVPLSSGGYWMSQVSGDEWLMFVEGQPGTSETFPVNLGQGIYGDAVGGGLEVAFSEGYTENFATVSRWESSPEVEPAGEGPVLAHFRMSVPDTTLPSDRLALVVDGQRIDMTPQDINPWMYEADVTLPGSGSYQYHVERDPDSPISRGPERVVEARLAEQNVIDWVVSWPDEQSHSINPDFIAGYYTPDLWSPSMLASTQATYDRIAKHNGNLVAVSSVWSYGRTQPLPNVEPRPVESPCVCLPYPDAVAQSGMAIGAGLDPFLAPQFNMEMTADGMDGLCCEPQTDEWWEAWRKSAEKLWLWNAKVASDTGAELLLLPGYVFHVFPQPGGFESDESYQSFDRSMIDLVDRVREIYGGKILISGGRLDTDLPGTADLVGVTTFDTGRPELPDTATVAEWAAGYEEHLKRVVDPIWERWGKPVFFYTVNPGSASEGSTAAFQDAQAAELEGIFQAFKSRPWIAGAMTWAYNYIDTPEAGDHGLRGRLAEAVLAKYYGQYTGKN